MPASYETWASATNVQWICSVSMLLVLVLPGRSIERHFTATLVWTAVCGLTGVTSCMLAPGYLARAYLDRSKHFGALGGLLGLCALLQLAVLLRYGVVDRSFTFDPRILTLPMLLQTIFVPLFGVEWVGDLSAPLRDGARALSAFTYVAGLGLMLFAVAAVPKARTARSPCSSPACGFWSRSSTRSARSGRQLDLISGKGGARYFLFGAMCFCLLLALGTMSRSRAAGICRSGAARH